MLFSFSFVIESVPAHYVCSFHKLTILGNWTRQIKILLLNHRHLCFFHSHIYFPACVCIVYVIRTLNGWVISVSATSLWLEAKSCCRNAAERSFSGRHWSNDIGILKCWYWLELIQSWVIKYTQAYPKKKQISLFNDAHFTFFHFTQLSSFCLIKKHRGSAWISNLSNYTDRKIGLFGCGNTVNNGHDTGKVNICLHLWSWIACFSSHFCDLSCKGCKSEHICLPSAPVMEKEKKKKKNTAESEGSKGRCKNSQCQTQTVPLSCHQGLMIQQHVLSCAWCAASLWEESCRANLPEDGAGTNTPQPAS